MTSSELSKLTGVTHTKVRRLALLFLGDDKKAKLRSGYKREFSFAEAWKIYLGSVLVSDLKMSVSEAKERLSQPTHGMVEVEVDNPFVRRCLDVSGLYWRFSNLIRRSQ